MSDVRSRRISRELFLAAFGGSLRSVEPWVTDRLTAMLEEEECAPGDRIYSEGEPPDHFYMLRQGRLEFLKKDRPVEIVEGPRAFGMIDALIERPRTTSAVAASAVQLFASRATPGSSSSKTASSSRGPRCSRSRARPRPPRNASGRAAVAPAPPSLPTLDGSSGPLDIVQRAALLMHTPVFRGVGRAAGQRPGGRGRRSPVRGGRAPVRARPVRSGLRDRRRTRRGGPERSTRRLARWTWSDRVRKRVLRRSRIELGSARHDADACPLVRRR